MDEGMIRLGAACAFLWAAAVPDHKTRRIPVWILAVFLAVVIAADLWTGGGLIKREYWTGAIPGALFLLLSFVTRGAVGEGDGLCILACGMCIGLYEIVPVLTGALWLSALTGAVTLLTGRSKEERELAFIPLLAAASSLRLVQMQLPAAIIGA